MTPCTPRRLAATACVIGVIALACGDDDPAGPSDAPDGHTVIEDGVAHAPGLDDPGTNCTTCHGADLRGGPDGQPSCFTCHGAVWLGRISTGRP